MSSLQDALLKAGVSRVTCPYCTNPAAKITGRELYPHRRDLYARIFWQCLPCDAYVGCHEGTDKPLGRLADAALRKAKMQAHEAFDALWQFEPQRSKARTEAYKWLATQLGITGKECHIGEFDLTRCQRVVQLVTERLTK